MNMVSTANVSRAESATLERDLAEVLGRLLGEATWLGRWRFVTSRSGEWDSEASGLLPGQREVGLCIECESPNIPPHPDNCVAHAPAAIEGAQAWMTVYQPADPKQFDSVCARLILGGAPVQGAKVSALSYRYGKDADYHATTDANGVAEMGFAVDDARNRYIVYIDVTITGPDGKHYTATTLYRPNYHNAP